jgi:hypothetical protein
MGTTFDDLRSVLGSPRVWGSAVRVSIAVAFGLVILFLAVTAFIVVLPVMFAAGLALHLYLRRKLRAARNVPPQAPHAPGRPVVIEGEYTVVETRRR